MFARDYCSTFQAQRTGQLRALRIRASRARAACKRPFKLSVACACQPPCLYKGKGSKALLNSYRPITLLNSDYKLLDKALATRFGPALQHVVDLTQTAFVPGRWIGDNVLCQLEEVEYLHQTGQPGCMAFVDFSRAYEPPWPLQGATIFYIYIF